MTNRRWAAVVLVNRHDPQLWDTLVDEHTGATVILGRFFTTLVLLGYGKEKQWWRLMMSNDPFFELDDLIAKGVKDMPFTIAANPSTNRVKRPHHYELLKLIWRLELVSLDAVRKCANALQKESTPFSKHTSGSKTESS